MKKMLKTNIQALVCWIIQEKGSLTEINNSCVIHVLALTLGQKRTSRVSNKVHFEIAASTAPSSMLHD